jgi:hypothetical protein
MIKRRNIMGFSKFMASVWGRLLRIVAGIALIVVGLLLVGGTWGIILAIIGAVPLLAGLFDVCLIGALFLGTPLKGSEVRGNQDQ